MCVIIVWLIFLGKFVWATYDESISRTKEIAEFCGEDKK
jgi:hypothetical protein